MSDSMHPKFIEAMEQLSKIKDVDPEYLNSDEGNRLFVQAVTHAPMEMKAKIEQIFKETIGKDMPPPTVFLEDGEPGYTSADLAKMTGETIEEINDRAKELAKIDPTLFRFVDPERHAIKAIVYLNKEGNWYVATCPLFDVGSQGRTEEEALRSVEEALQLFFETCADMGTLGQVMREVGMHAPQPEPSHTRNKLFQHMIHIPLSEVQYAQAIAS